MYKWNSNVKFLSFMDLSAVLFIIKQKKMCFQKGCFLDCNFVNFKFIEIGVTKIKYNIYQRKRHDRYHQLKVINNGQS